MQLLLQALEATFPYEQRIAADPVEFPRRYSDARDIEVSGLLSAMLAYGRATLFKPKLAWLLERMGSSPASFVSELTPKGAARQFEGFVYRFNNATDLSVLLLGMGQALRRFGSLEGLYLGARTGEEPLQARLAAFSAQLRAVPMEPLRRLLGPERGLAHLISSPEAGGAAKRLNLFLRWMVRGPDRVDLGIWRRVSPSSLVIPVDTHVARVARHLGLTARKDLSFRTAEEITESLRQIDPVDPVRYDFVLCHLGMSGQCPRVVATGACRVCALAGSCRTGRRVLGRADRS